MAENVSDSLDMAYDYVMGLFGDVPKVLPTGGVVPQQSMDDFIKQHRFKESGKIYKHVSSDTPAALPLVEKAKTEQQLRLGKILDTGNVYTQDTSAAQKHGVDISDRQMNFVGNIVDRFI